MPARVARQPDRRGVRTRAALLQAGRALLATRDVDALSVDEIVTVADVAKGSFYNHFVDKDMFAREIGAAVRRQAEQAVEAANAGIHDPALRLARAVCVFIRFAVEHRDSAQVLWRLNSGATMADAPVNRALCAEVSAFKRQRRLAGFDEESAVLLVMGTIVIAMRHALEERAATPPAALAARMAAGMLRALMVADRSARALAAQAAAAIYDKDTTWPLAASAARNARGAVRFRRVKKRVK
jgi:AcrR family transcriptional regulator